MQLNNFDCTYYQGVPDTSGCIRPQLVPGQSPMSQPKANHPAPRPVLTRFEKRSQERFIFNQISKLTVSRSICWTSRLSNRLVIQGHIPGMQYPGFPTSGNCRRIMCRYRPNVMTRTAGSVFLGSCFGGRRTTQTTYPNAMVGDGSG